VSWGEYQEHLPYSGFEGDWKNQQTGASDYVRKHKYVCQVSQPPLLPRLYLQGEIRSLSGDNAAGNHD